MTSPATIREASITVVGISVAPGFPAILPDCDTNSPVATIPSLKLFA